LQRSFRSLSIILLFSSFILSSCSKKTEGENTPLPKTVSEESTEVKKEAEQEAEKGYELDLRNMNYNMLSGITFEMLVEPEKYAGKSLAISGQFYSEIYEEKRYYSVIVWDATLCCPAGMDFIPPEGLLYPDDFPADEEEIVVYGSLRLTEENSLLFEADKIEF